MTDSRLTLARYLSLALATAGLALALARVQPDATYVGYRYARHMAQEQTFTYNPGDENHIAAAPFYVFLLADLSHVGLDLPVLGVLLSAVFVGAGGWLLLASDGEPVETTAAALLYVSFPLWWLEAGLETALFGLLVLAATLLAAREKTVQGAIVAGLALLLRPIGLLLGGVLLVDAAFSRKRVPLRELAGWGAGAALSLGLSVWAYGLNFPQRWFLGGTPGGLPMLTAGGASSAFAALVQLGGALGAQSWLWAAVLLLASVGAVRLRERWWLTLLLVWAFIHIVMLDVLGATPTRGDFAPLVPVVAGLAGAGAGVLWERYANLIGSYTLGGLLAALLLVPGLSSLVAIGQAPRQDDTFYATRGPAMLPNTPPDTYREAAAWLADNTPPDAIIAANHIGLVSYLSERATFDTSGLLDAGTNAALKRGDPFWYVPHYAPEVVLVAQPDFQSDSGYQPLNDQWFTATYSEARRFGTEETFKGPLIVYQRQATPPALNEYEIRERTAQGLRLDAVATNLALLPLESDQLVFMELTWLPQRSLPARQFIVVRLENNDGLSAGQVSQVVLTGQWPLAQRVTTYHSFETSSNLVPGLHRLKVGIGDDLEQLEWVTALEGKVPIGQEPVGGGLSGAGGRWPGLAALRGYRLNLTQDNTLGVMLVWDALGGTDEPYLMRVELRDSTNRVVAFVEGPPHAGTYPTTVWESGETIPGEHTLDLTGVPPGEYDLFVGWLTPDGQAVVSSEGQTMREIGRVLVETR